MAAELTALDEALLLEDYRRAGRILREQVRQHRAHIARCPAPLVAAPLLDRWLEALEMDERIADALEKGPSG